MTDGLPRWTDPETMKIDRSRRQKNGQLEPFAVLLDEGGNELEIFSQEWTDCQIWCAVDLANRTYRAGFEAGKYGIFEAMRRSQALQDFLLLVGGAIRAKNNPVDLADSFVGLILRDQSGQAHLIYNFFISSTAAMIADELRPPLKIARSLRSKSGRNYWKGFSTRLRLIIEQLHIFGGE
ncbi:MAG: hypothetical protein ABIJ57_01800 [Pseudomonadota bacterium]